MNVVVMVSPFPTKCLSKVDEWSRCGLSFNRITDADSGVYEVTFPHGTTKERHMTRKGDHYDVYTTPSGVRFTVGPLARHGFSCLSQPAPRVFELLFNHPSAGTSSPAYSEYSAAAK